MRRPWLYYSQTQTLIRNMKQTTLAALLAKVVPDKVYYVNTKL